MSFYKIGNIYIFFSFKPLLSQLNSQERWLQLEPIVLWLLPLHSIKEPCQMQVLRHIFSRWDHSNEKLFLRHVDLPSITHVCYLDKWCCILLNQVHRFQIYIKNYPTHMFKKETDIRVRNDRMSVKYTFLNMSEIK